MLRRLLAWISLIGFVALIINLLTFRFLWQLSIMIYIIIIVFFLLTNNKSKQRNNPDEAINGNKDSIEKAENDDMQH